VQILQNVINANYRLGFQPQAVEHFQLDELFSPRKLMTAYLALVENEIHYLKEQLFGTAPLTDLYARLKNNISIDKTLFIV